MTIDFATILASSPNPYVVMDTDLRLVWMNDAYLAATMRKREEILGQRMFDAFPSDQGSDSFRLLNDSLHRVLRTGEVDEIALIRYDIMSPDGSMQTHYWSATHTPILDEFGNVELILQHTVDVTELQELRQLREEANLIRRAEQVQVRNASLELESKRLNEFFEQAPGFVAVLGGSNHVFQMANTAYLELVGQRDIIGEKIAEVLPEVVDQGFIDILDRVYETGEPYLGFRERVLLKSASSGDEDTLFLNFIYQPISNGDDDFSGIIVQGYDVTDEVLFEEKQALLINELQHRVKNTIAVVQSLAKQTFKPFPAASAAVEMFSARLTALSAAHGLLTEKSWGPTSLKTLLNSTLSASLGELSDLVFMDGEECLLDPETALGLTMVIHELATNAVKYGSLSVEGGKVDIGWTTIPEDEENVVHMIWRETDGPLVTEPVRTGFGTRLIERGLKSGGESGVIMDFEPSGLKCSLEFSIPTNPEGSEHGRAYAKFRKSR